MDFHWPHKGFGLALNSFLRLSTKMQKKPSKFPAFPKKAFVYRYGVSEIKVEGVLTKDFFHHVILKIAGYKVKASIGESQPRRLSIFALLQ